MKTRFKEWLRINRPSASEEMARLTVGQRIYAVDEMIKTGSVTRTRRKLQTKFGLKISEKAIYKLCIKWKTHGTVTNQNKGNSGRRFTARTEENIDKVRTQLNTSDLSLRKLSAATDVSTSSIQRILKTDLQFKSYKIQVSQELKEGDAKKRLEFCLKMVQLMEAEELDPADIIFSDESHVYLSSSPNKQNSRLWRPKKPEIRNHVPLHSMKVTVWGGLTGSKVFGPYFYEEEDTGKATTVTKERYITMLSEIFPEDSDENVCSLVFMQDGAPAHTSRVAMDWLKRRFGDRLISNKADFIWPARSPDLNPMDFYFWGHMKQKIHEGSPKTLMDVKILIEDFFRQISGNRDLLKRVTAQFCSRLKCCIQADGGLFE